MDSNMHTTRTGFSMDLCLCLAAFALAGCGTTEQQVTTIVRDAAVCGPIFSPPVNVASENARNSLTVSAHAMVPRKSLLDGFVEGSEPTKAGWLYPADTVRLSDGRISVRRQVPRTNLSWQHPEFSAGLHCDIAWKTMALSFGGSLSESGGSTLLGWSAGLGFFSGDSGKFRVRLDVGVFGQSLDYDARSVTITTTTSTWLFGGTSRTIDTAFYHDTKTSRSTGYYGSITLNSANPSWPVNFFVQGNLIAQPVLS
jgi:hypothetical protein